MTRFILSIVVIVVLTNSCKITRPPIHYNYIYESKTLRSIDMNETESEYLDKLLLLPDSLQYDIDLYKGLRKVVYRNTKEVLMADLENQENKLISAKFCVDRKGQIIYTELLKETNAIIESGSISDVLRGIAGYLVSQDTLAPIVQCGKMNIRINKINRMRE